MTHRLKTMLAIVALTVAAAVMMNCSERINGPAGPGGNGSITVIVHNNSSFDLDTVLFSRYSDSLWGGNRIGAGAVLAPGKTMTLQAAEGSWSLEVYTGGASHLSYYTTFTVDTGSNQIYIADSNIVGGTLRYTNYSDITMYRLLRRPHGVAAWSANQISSTDSMSLNSFYEFSSVPAATYDLRAENRDGSVWAETLGVVIGQLEDVEWTINTETLHSNTLGMIRMINGSSISIYSLAVRPYAGAPWGPDLLNGHPVYSGDSVSVLALVPGTYDLKAASLNDIYSAETTAVQVSLSSTVRWSADSLR